jgi:hypothetical protein
VQNKDKVYWDRLAGGSLSFGEYRHPDTMDEFTLYCALVEKTQMTHCPRAVHLQGPEVLHRNAPRLYHGWDEKTLPILAERWSHFFCVYATLAVYFIAGNWTQQIDCKKMRSYHK